MNVQKMHIEKQVEDGLRRLKSLTGSLECLLSCALELEDASQLLASAIFVTVEMKEAIERIEVAISSPRMTAAND